MLDGNGGSNGSSGTSPLFKELEELAGKASDELERLFGERSKAMARHRQAIKQLRTEHRREMAVYDSQMTRIRELIRITGGKPTRTKKRPSPEVAAVRRDRATRGEFTPLAMKHAASVFASIQEMDQETFTAADVHRHRGGGKGSSVVQTAFRVLRYFEVIGKVGVIEGTNREKWTVLSPDNINMIQTTEETANA